MFIQSIEINNFRLFSSKFAVNDFNVPDMENEGSGLTVLVGENGCGKTSILDAIAFSLLEYKKDTLKIDDLNNPADDCLIKTLSRDPFTVKGTMPKSEFQARGFLFKASMRKRASSDYLSTMIASDLYYVSTDPNTPKSGSPDLRVSVNNPFSGKRFNDNEYLVLDNNRTYQIKSGTFNQTRFDRLMEDLDYQYVKHYSNKPINLNSLIADSVHDCKVDNYYFADATNEFCHLTGIKLNLDFIDNYHPFSGASFVGRKDNNLQVKLSSMGSGYEMLFVLVYSYHLSLRGDKQLIILIDEPEMHLHPNLQKILVDFLLKISSTAQIIISTHSSLLIKQIAKNDYVKTLIINRDKTITPMSDRKLPYLSANETNYLAFGLPSEEYHNELYEYLLYSFSDDGNMSIRKFDNKFFVDAVGEKKDSPWRGEPNAVSRHTFIRNKIHHRYENGTVAESELLDSIQRMRELCNNSLFK